MKASTAQKLELYNQGMTDEGIAEQLGLSRTTVTSWRNYHGLEVRETPSGCPMEDALNPRECEIMKGFLASLLRVPKRPGTKLDVLAYAREYGKTIMDKREELSC